MKTLSLRSNPLLICAAFVLALLSGLPASAQQISSAIPPPRDPRPRVVGYYTQWSVYNNFFVKNLVTSGSAKVLTQINYAFATITDGRCASADTWADFQDPLPASATVDGQADPQGPTTFAGNFHQLRELKQRYPGLKVAISVGGGAENPSVFSMVADAAHRKAFVKSCVDMYIKGEFGPGVTEPGVFDGIDIDWEYPASDTDKANFTALLAEFRKQMDGVRNDLTLSIASSAGSWAYQYIDLNNVQKSIDFFDLMTYDFDGPWHGTTGFVAPLYASKLDPDQTNNAAAAVEGYLAAGVQPQKIVFGVPFYGYQWTDVPNTHHGLFQPGTTVGDGAGYNQIVGMEGSYTKYRDQTTQEPWLYNGTTFWTYDDPLSLGYKMLYARRHQLGGVMAWELSGDTPDASLLKTAAFLITLPRF